MSHTTKYGHHSADNTVTRLIPVAITLSQVQLQTFEAELKKQISLKVNSRSDLIIQYDAAVFGFTQVLSQLEHLDIKVRDSRWFRIKAEWYEFVDNNMASNANQRPKPCCNKVPRI